MTAYTEDALLLAIAAAPDDDRPRVEYADWCRWSLGEGGRLRAELIRIQLSLHHLAAGHPDADRLAAECEQLVIAAGPGWMRELWTHGWAVHDFGRGLPSVVVSRRGRGDVRPCAYLAGIERMELQPHEQIANTVAELSQSHWSNSVRELVLPVTAGALTVVSLAISPYFRNLNRLKLPLELVPVFYSALRKSREARAAACRPPTLLHLRAVNDTPLV